MWETNVISDPYGYASSTRPYVEVLAEAAVVVGLAEAPIVVWSSSKSKSA